MTACRTSSSAIRIATRSRFCSTLEGGSSRRQSSCPSSAPTRQRQLSSRARCAPSPSPTSMATGNRTSQPPSPFPERPVHPEEMTQSILQLALAMKPTRRRSGFPGRRGVAHHGSRRVQRRRKDRSCIGINDGYDRADPFKQQHGIYSRSYGYCLNTRPAIRRTPTSTPTVPPSSLQCDTARGDADCSSSPRPFCSLTGPGTQGICCDTPCTGANERCDLPGSEGMCKATALNNGEPCDVAGQCNSNVCAQGYCCNTSCDGVNNRCDTQGSVGSCVLVPHVFTPTSTVPPPATRTPTRTPTANGGLKQLGENCVGGTECMSNICQNSVCCASVCAANESCNLNGAAGTCLPQSLPNGDPCSAAAQCVSGNCPIAAGLCCNTACNGANERCDVPGSEGICVNTGGSNPTPTATRTATQRPTPTRTIVTIIAARGSGCSIGSTGDSSSSFGWFLVLPLAWWFGSRMPLLARLRRSIIRVQRGRSR